MPLIEVVENSARLGIQTDMPHPTLIGNRLNRLDGDMGIQKVRAPCSQNPAQRIEARTRESQVEHGIVAIAPFPVAGVVLLRQNVGLDVGNRRLAHRVELSERTK